MPTWAPGNKPSCPPRAHAAAGPARGFTLLELLIVVALIAVASAVASLALPDPAHTRLEQEAARLATLLEAGRAQSRALGVPVYWVPGPAAGAALDGRPVEPFHFAGLPEGHGLPQRWLGPPDAEALQIRLAPTRRALQLGPEPIIGAQRVELVLAGRSLVLATDGLGPFRIADDAPQP